MRVHLRFTEKDTDLCRWRHSVKRNMLSYYLNQIMLAEINGKIAFIPNSVGVSVDTSPCDVTWRINNYEIEEYLIQIPSYKRNEQIKEIIRKHLDAQGMLMTGFSVPTETKPAKEQAKIKKQPRKQFNQPPVQEKPKEEFMQTDEERDAIMALIAMGGE